MIRQTNTDAIKLINEHIPDTLKFPVSFTDWNNLTPEDFSKKPLRRDLSVFQQVTPQLFTKLASGEVSFDEDSFDLYIEGWELAQKLRPERQKSGIITGVKSNYVPKKRRGKTKKKSKRSVRKTPPLGKPSGVTTVQWLNRNSGM